jgi:hypothetical protein
MISTVRTSLFENIEPFLGVGSDLIGGVGGGGVVRMDAQGADVAVLRSIGREGGRGQEQGEGSRNSQQRDFGKDFCFHSVKKIYILIMKGNSRSGILFGSGGAAGSDTHGGHGVFILIAQDDRSHYNQDDGEDED